MIELILFLILIAIAPGLAIILTLGIVGYLLMLRWLAK
jgi:hypothetical protein